MEVQRCDSSFRFRRVVLIFDQVYSGYIVHIVLYIDIIKSFKSESFLASYNYKYDVIFVVIIFIEICFEMQSTVVTSE